MASDFVVLIATTGRPTLLERTLESLSACSRPESYRETIVVENGPKQGAEDVVARFRESLHGRYLHVAQPNKSHALNVALRELDDCFVLFTDDDVRLDAETLCAYDLAARARAAGSFFGGPVRADYDEAPPDWILEFAPPSVRGWSLGDAQHVVARPQFLGCNWGAFVRDLRTAGPFDANMGLGAPTGSVGEETEMQLRFASAGMAGVYVPGALVWHFVPKERCSPKWIVGRAYKLGIFEAMLAPDDKGPQLLGYPRWTHRELARRWWDVVRDFARGNQQQLFRSRYLLSYFRGSRRGMTMRRQLIKDD